MSRKDAFSTGRGPKNQAEEAAQAYHAKLAPMKETIRSSGASFSAVSGHLQKHARIIFGEPMSKKDTLHWAVKKHAEDPKNFLKNIGFQK